MSERGTERNKVKRGKRAKPARARTVQQPGRINALVSRIPVKAESMERAVTWGMVSMVGLAALGVAWMSGLPGYVGKEMAQAAGRAGFQVKRVEVNGVERMDRLTVYAIALDQHSMAMPLVDLDKIRNDLRRYGWIEEARVSRRLPDTLVVDITERRPAAIWQNNRKLTLIDDKGIVLERISPAAAPDLPILIGRDANREAVAFNDLIAKAPSLKSALASATWVGGRRWDVQFDTGETLALPEGEKESAKALLRFARIDGVEKLRGRGFVRFDMRDPSKMIVRVARDGKKMGDTPPPATGGAMATSGEAKSEGEG